MSLMSVTITAVPAVANGIESAPATGAAHERTLTEFVAALRSNSTSSMPHLANPAALASELFGSLRGYFERAQHLGKGPRRMQSRGIEGDGPHLTLTSLASEPRTEQTALHGGPARQNLEPVEANAGVSPAVGVSLAQLQRVMDLALESMNFATETTLVARGTSQIAGAANTLLRGQ
jgi:hypothetical protein